MIAYIYKISSDYGDLCYVGSTIRRLQDRYKDHKDKYRAWKRNPDKKYFSSYEIFEKYGIENCKITIIEKIDYTTQGEIREKERHYIGFFDTVNILR